MRSSLKIAAVVLAANLLIAATAKALPASGNTTHPTGCESQTHTRALADGGSAADVETVSAPVAALQWFVSLMAIWLFSVGHLAKSRSKKAESLECDMNPSQKRLDLLSRDPSHVSTRASARYRGIIDGYDRLKNGIASAAEIDELRRRARSFLSGRDEQGQDELREIRMLLEWLDDARAHGKITITIQQWRVRKMGKWDVECGIAAGVQTARAKMNVNGNMEVVNCTIKLPWDPSGSINLWMHLSEIGYETCWGHFGPISMSAKEVLQEASGCRETFMRTNSTRISKSCLRSSVILAGFPCSVTNALAE